jgi:VanZ family protein
MQSSSFLNRLYKFLLAHVVSAVYLPLAIYWIVLFIGTTLPADEIPHFFNSQDKLEHFLAYLGLAALINLTLFLQNKIVLDHSKAFLLSILFVMIYGAIDEIHQIWIPSRVCDFFDWCADSLGGFTGAAIIYLYLKSEFVKKMKR